MAGTLFIVATPIGNLADISLRALETLKKVDLIAAEDTRHSAKLLQYYGIKTALVSLHNFNEMKCADFLITKLEQGKNIALISDAGTPLISDPGYYLAKKVREKNLNIVPIPGPCAAITALSAAGLATEKFIFAGFLPPKTVARQKKLAEFAQEMHTVIFYEAPHRLMQLIEDMMNVFGAERFVVLAKELTKIHETIFGANLKTMKVWLEEKPERQKGEFVILLQGTSEEKTSTISAEAHKILQILLQELPPKQAVNLTAKITNTDKRILYEFAIKK